MNIKLISAKYEGEWLLVGVAEDMKEARKIEKEFHEDDAEETKIESLSIPIGYEYQMREALDSVYNCLMIFPVGRKEDIKGL